MTDTPDPVAVGSQLLYQIVVSNPASTDATGVVVTQTLPTGVTFVTASPGADLDLGKHPDVQPGRPFPPERRGPSR